MKKFAVAILALVYITTSVGANIHMHYCMGLLADWGLSTSHSKVCSKCGMEKTEGKDKGCCKDKQQFVKNVADQKVAESSIQFTQSFANAISVGFFEPSINYFSPPHPSRA